LTGEPGSVEGVLDREGNPMEGTEFGTAGDRLVGGVADPQRVLGTQSDDGIDLRVHLLDAVQVGLDDFAGGDLLRGDQFARVTALLVGVVVFMVVLTM
jgi:hypothetical protein